jgi:hypothetical protein
MARKNGGRSTRAGGNRVEQRARRIAELGLATGRGRYVVLCTNIVIKVFSVVVEGN